MNNEKEERKKRGKHPIPFIRLPCSRNGGIEAQGDGRIASVGWFDCVDHR